MIVLDEEAKDRHCSVRGQRLNRAVINWAGVRKRGSQS